MNLDMQKLSNLLNVHFNLYNLSGIDHLVSTLKDMTYLPNRKSDGNFVFSVDHCFSIKGQGTILTGTIIQGAVSLNDVSSYLVQLRNGFNFDFFLFSEILLLYYFFEPANSFFRWLRYLLSKKPEKSNLFKCSENQ